MGATKIDDCCDPRCPADPAFLRNASCECNCAVCGHWVYDCSASPGDPDWRRIEADPRLSPQILKVDDIVRITHGHFENFQASVFRVNPDDQAALVNVHIFSRIVSFWISFKRLELVSRKD